VWHGHGCQTQHVPLCGLVCVHGECMQAVLDEVRGSSCSAFPPLLPPTHHLPILFTGAAWMAWRTCGLFNHLPATLRVWRCSQQGMGHWRGGVCWTRAGAWRWPCTARERGWGRRARPAPTHRASVQGGVRPRWPQLCTTPCLGVAPSAGHRLPWLASTCARGGFATGHHWPLW